MILLCVEAAKEAEAAHDDDMNGLQSDEEDDAEGSDKEMGVDAEDGDEDNNKTLQRLAAQVCYNFSRFQKRNWNIYNAGLSKTNV